MRGYYWIVQINRRDGSKRFISLQRRDGINLVKSSKTATKFSLEVLAKIVSDYFNQNHWDSTDYFSRELVLIKRRIRGRKSGSKSGGSK